jgi:hypothetical protein
MQPQPFVIKIVNTEKRFAFADSAKGDRVFVPFGRFPNQEWDKGRVVFVERLEPVLDKRFPLAVAATWGTMDQKALLEKKGVLDIVGLLSPTILVMQNPILSERWLAILAETDMTGNAIWRDYTNLRDDHEVPQVRNFSDYVTYKFHQVFGL